MATLKENVLVFDSGRKIKINTGNISINCAMEVYQGYGLPILRYDPDSQRDAEVDAVCNTHNLSEAETLELTECMAQLWLTLQSNILKHGLKRQSIFHRE